MISEWFIFWSDRQHSIAQACITEQHETNRDCRDELRQKWEVLCNNTLILYLRSEWWWLLISSLEVKVQVISFREDSPKDMCLFPGNYVCRLPLKETLFWRVKVVVNAVKVRSSIMVWIPVKQREREREREREQETEKEERGVGKERESWMSSSQISGSFYGSKFGQ